MADLPVIEDILDTEDDDLPEPMTERELVTVVDRMVEAAAGHVGGEISDERRKALRYYRGEPFGNEIEDRSQVVSHDVAEAVESIMPSLMDIFAAGDVVVRWNPTGEDDEKAAEQATEYVNWIVNQQNDGFGVTYTWFKDALLQKVGIVKAWWDVERETVRERYDGLTPQEKAIIEADEDVEILSVQHRNVMGPVPMMQTAIPGYVCDMEVRRTRYKGRVHLANVPPENFLIGSNAVWVHDTPFVGERYRKTLSDLIEMGFDRETVMDLPSDSFVEMDDEERERRDSREWADTTEADESMREVEVVEAYLRVDFDGDGIAELRKVIKVGQTVLENEEVEDNPYAALTPVLMPHVFHGRSIADQTMDIQLVKSVLWRGILDNIYLTNSPQREVAESHATPDTLDDLLTSRPGGVVRTKQPGGIIPLPVPFMAKDAFVPLEHLDRDWERRTGAFRHSEGPDANALAATATGANMLENTAQRRVKLIARLFAETGVKRLYRIILKLLVRHQNEVRKIRLRDQWVPMDPRWWNVNMDMTAAVGLGTGNKDQQVVHATNVLGIQKGIAEAQGGIEGPLLTPKNVYNAAAKLVEAVGFKEVEHYFTDPDGPAGKEAAAKAAQRPDPRMAEVQGKLQLETGKAQAQLQADQAKFSAEHQRKIAELQAENALKREQMQWEISLKREQMQWEFALKEREMQLDAALSLRQSAQDGALKKHEIDTRVEMGGEPG